MKETGVEIPVETVQSSDVVITMGRGDACPSFPANAPRTGS
ncbi:hypothetical protein [Streptosporangium oxazolinicum]